jgi:hypothetical protein
MKNVKTMLLVLICISSVGWGPFLVFPGGQLTGTVAEVPADWTFMSEVGTVELETRPDDPYSVNIWATGIADTLYIHAGANRARWVEQIEANPNVRVRIGRKIYLLKATRVREAAEFARFVIAYTEKYGSRPRNENVDEVYLYRLRRH